MLCERIADLCRPIGRRETAQEHYQTGAAGLSAAQGDHAAAARIMRKVGRLLWDAGKRDQGRGALRRGGSSLLEGTDAPIERAHLLQERGRLAFRMGDHAGAAKWADEAIGYAATLPTGSWPRRSGSKRRARLRRRSTPRVSPSRGSGATSRRCARSSAAWQWPKRPACRAWHAAPTPISACSTRWSIRRAPSRSAAAASRSQRRIGDLGFQARLYANLAVACCTFTDRCGEEGVPAAEKAIEIDRALDQREHLAVPLIVLGQIHQCHGAPDLALRYYHEALEVARETGEPQLLFPCYDGLATL